MTDLVLFGLWVGLAFALTLAYDAIRLLATLWRKLMPKTYGPDTVPEIPEIPFALRAVHEDPQTGKREIRTHQFIAKPDPSAGDFYRFARAASSKENSGGELLIVLSDILPRMIANDDGVPFQWEYRELPQGVEIQAGPSSDVAVLGTLEEELEPIPNFRGPDGQIYPEPERKRFEEFEAGSSRRRLHALMFTDENVKVEMQTVAEIMKDLFAAAGKGRTSA
jgi:hypothetical protein